MQRAGTALDPEASPRGAPSWAVVACLLSGAALPAFTYGASRSGALDWLWPLRPGADSDLLIALGLAGAFVTGLLACAGVASRWRIRAAAPRAPRLWNALAATALVLGTGALLVRWPHNYSVGDWATWVKLADDPMLMPSEPLGRSSHYLFFRIVSETALDHWLRLDAKTLALRLSSVAAGMFYLAWLLAWARKVLPSSSSWTTVPFLFVTPTLVIYAGHLETTPWAYAFTGAYLLAGVHYLEAGHQRAPWFEALLLMLAVGSHGVVCFVTGAHAILCLHWFFAPRSGAPLPWMPRRVAELIGVALLPFLVLTAAFAWAYHFPASWGFWYGNALGGSDNDLFVAFSERATGVYGRIRLNQFRFGSWAYTTGLLNVFLFACPLLLVLPLALWHTLQFRFRSALFLLAGFAGLLLLSLFWNPDLGHRDDYDLLALVALPATLLIALWWDSQFGGRQRWIVALGAVTSSFVFLVAPRLQFP